MFGMSGSCQEGGVWLYLVSRQSIRSELRAGKGGYQTSGPTITLHAASQPLCNLLQGWYRYTDDLRALHLGQVRCTPAIPPLLQCITTPLRAKAWEKYLADYPDQEFAQYLLHGIQRGFRIGCQGNSRGHRAKRNLHSAYEHPEIIDAYLAREVNSHRVVRLPLAVAHSIPTLRISPIGVIPKHNRPNKWRLIVDLSSPEGSSVNDGVDPALCSIKYASVDDAVSIIQKWGTGTLLAKVDLKEANRSVPVAPEDCPLLGMWWKESVYIDTCLSFGLRSAPQIFSALADGLMWFLHSKGMSDSLHYLDDFLLLGPPDSPVCAEALRILLQLCEELGALVAGEKTEGPTTLLDFLGIELDTRRLQMRLPQRNFRISLPG